MAPKAETEERPAAASLPAPPPDRRLPQHGVKGAYYGGEWVDIEDFAGTFHPTPGTDSASTCASCPSRTKCPRSKSRNDASKSTDRADGSKAYDVAIVGAGCVGSAVARELSRYDLSTILVEAADDVSQGATKGNSGIVHAGYDDKPGTVRAKYCWPGNQMFPKLDRELRFGYQRNGSLVVALREEELPILDELKKRGETNGVERLRILTKKELFEMEPAVNPAAVGALHSPDAGNVIPYEFAIALAENAVDNGVEVRVRREAIRIDKEDGEFVLKLRHWEPKSFVDFLKSGKGKSRLAFGALSLSTVAAMGFGFYMILDDTLEGNARQQAAMATLAVLLSGLMVLHGYLSSEPSISPTTPLKALVEKASPAVGEGGRKMEVEDMFTGGSGSWNAVKGVAVDEETVRAKYIVNCAGGASDKIARLIGDDSFTIKPRLGDYLLLNRNQGHLTRRTLFPCPDPILGKGVLVQTTLWGNLILGPTARDTYKPEARDLSSSAVQEYILSKCKALVPYFDPKETIHAFCGARAKNSTGDWIVRPSEKDPDFIHAAGIDSPGLAGCPAIALEVVRLLQTAGLKTPPDPNFNPNRAPIITPKAGTRGLKMGPVGKNDSNGTEAEEDRMASNVICKCERVTELEVVRAMRRSLPIDSTQAIRKRTRAGMGHCQGDAENYDCERRVKAIVARENRVPVEEVGGRPWPATSTLSRRWIDEEEKEDLQKRMMAQ